MLIRQVTWQYLNRWFSGMNMIFINSPKGFIKRDVTCRHKSFNLIFDLSFFTIFTLSCKYNLVRSFVDLFVEVFDSFCRMNHFTAYVRIVAQTEEKVKWNNKVLVHGDLLSFHHHCVFEVTIFWKSSPISWKHMFLDNGVASKVLEIAWCILGPIQFLSCRDC